MEPVSSSANTQVLQAIKRCWKKSCDKGELVAIVILDLSKAFDFLPHLLLIKRLEAYGLDNRSYSFLLALVVQKVDSAIPRINYYPVDSAISFRNNYPLDSDLSGG